MKYLIILLLLTLALSSCVGSMTHKESIVNEITYCDKKTDIIKTRFGKGFVPHGMYQVGDTIRFCK